MACNGVQTWTWGLKAQKPLILVTKAANTGSMDEWRVPQKPFDKMNSVKVATMRTEVSARTSARAASKVKAVKQSMTWDDFMASREAMFNPVMLRLTLLSPMMVKSLESDILVATWLTWASENTQLQQHLLPQTDIPSKLCPTRSGIPSWLRVYSQREPKHNDVKLTNISIEIQLITEVCENEPLYSSVLRFIYNQANSKVD